MPAGTSTPSWGTPVSNVDDLKLHLLAIAEHTRDALALLDDGVSITPPIQLPTGSTACTHANKRPGMGGYWTCLECGAKGRDG